MRERGDWLPSLPDGWRKSHLRWHADVYSGGTPARDVPAYWSDGSIPWLASGAVNQWEITQPSEFITERGLKESAARWVPEHAVVMGLAGQGRTKGMVARTAIRATCNQSMCAIIPDRSLEHRFLHFWLSVNHDNIRNLAGGDKRDGLNHEHVRSIVIPLPPAGVQARIADYLDCETAEIDAMDAELDQLVETLRERRLAVVERVLSPGFEGGGVQPLWSLLGPTKDQGHPGEQVLSVYRDYGVIPKGSRDDNHNRTPADLSSYQLVQLGDVVINKMKAWQGSLGVSGHRGIVSPDYQICRPLGSEVDSRYLHLVLRSPQMIPQYGVRSKGIRPSQWRLYWEDMATLTVPVPSPDEQRRIVAELDEQTAQIDAMIADAERLKGLLAERRSTLITDVVTGKKEVPA